MWVEVTNWLTKDLVLEKLQPVCWIQEKIENNWHFFRFRIAVYLCMIREIEI